ncbi:MAG: hypothetical protein ACREXY_08375, partial [Gammaproteobacteria bacterium]
ALSLASLMPRWKQRFVCLECCHSAWREVETEAFAAAPNPTKLEAGGFYCSYCFARRYRVHQVKLLAGRWADAFKIEGMRGGHMTFDQSAARDVEIRQAIEKRDRANSPSRLPV